MEIKIKPNKRYLKNLEKHKDSAQEALKYSSDRFDIILVSLSTSALILSIGFAENLIQDKNLIEIFLLKVTWVLFAGSLVFNLLSQVTSYYSHIYDIKLTTNLIRKERSKDIIGNQKSFKWWCKTFNNSTIIQNGISLMCLIAGIIVLLIFFINNI